MTRNDQNYLEKLTVRNKVLSLFSNCYCKIRSFIPPEFSLSFSLNLYHFLLLCFSLSLFFPFLCLSLSLSLFLYFLIFLSVSLCLFVCDYLCDCISVCLPRINLIGLFILFSLTKLFFYTWSPFQIAQNKL